MKQALTTGTQLILTTILLFGTIHGASLTTDDDKVRLHEIQALLVEPDDHLPEHMRIGTAVGAELAAEGFAVVSRVEEADAVLEIRWAVDRSSDGGPNDYPRDIFSLVVRTRGGEHVWDGTVILAAATNEQATLRYRARRIVAALQKAWRESAR